MLMVLCTFALGLLSLYRTSQCCKYCIWCVLLNGTRKLCIYFKNHINLISNRSRGFHIFNISTSHDPHLSRQAQSVLSAKPRPSPRPVPIQSSRKNVTIVSYFVTIFLIPTILRSNQTTPNQPQLQLPTAPNFLPTSSTMVSELW